MAHHKTTSDSYVHDEHFSPITNHHMTRFIMECTPLILLANNEFSDILANPNGDNDTIDEVLKKPMYFEGFGKFLAQEATLFDEVMRRLDKLQHTIFMISFFPAKPEKNNLPLTRAEYIEDLLELYVSNSIALEDRALTLVNFLYDLNVDVTDYDKKDKIITKLTDTAVKSSLEKLDYILSAVRKSRNLIIHSTSYYDESLENIFQMEIRYRNLREDPQEADTATQMVKEINRQYKAYEQDKLVDLYTNDAILTKVMVEFLDALYFRHKEIVNQNKNYVGKYGKINPREKKRNSIRQESLLVSAVNMDTLMKVVKG